MILQLMQKHLKIIFIFILVFMIVPFLFWGMSSYTRQPGDKDKDSNLPSGRKISKTILNQAFWDGRTSLIIGIVISNKITWDKFNMYQDWINQMLKNQDQAQIAIKQLVLQEETRKYGLTVSREEIAAWLLDFPLFQRSDNGTFDMEIYKMTVQNIFNTWPVNFEKSLERILSIKKLQDIMLKTVFVSEDEVYEAYKNRNEKVAIYTADFDSINYLNQVAPLEKAELEEYYEKHKEEFREPEKIKIAYLLFDPDTIKKEIEQTVSQEEIQEYYDENRIEFTGTDGGTKTLPEVQVEIKNIVTDIKAQNKMQDIALDTSISLTDDKRIGDMRTLAKEKDWNVQETDFLSKTEFIPEAGWSPQLMASIWEMDLGSISNLISAGNRWIIASPIEKQPSQIPDLSEVEAQVTERIKKEKAEQLAREDAQKQLGSISTDLPFTMASKSIGLKVKKSKPLAKHNPLGKSVFEKEKNPIKTPTGYAIYSVREFYLVDPAQWEKEKDQFKEKYLSEKQRNFLNNWIQSLVVGQ